MNSDMKEVLSGFQSMKKALIDASSIITIKKAGFFSELSEAVALYSLKEIIEETGYDDLPLSLLEAGTETASNDEKLISCALREKIPVISEDRKILMAMKNKNIPYYNALMMLHFLLFKKKLDAKTHLACQNRLKKTARYGGDVLKFAGNVYRAVAEIH
jgi:hypothetical protein